MTNKPIQLSEHAKEQLAYRGASEDEIVSAVRSCKWSPAELGRLECRKDFEYKKSWNGKHYKTKQVRPIFAEQTKEIIVVTVYVYYF